MTASDSVSPEKWSLLPVTSGGTAGGEADAKDEPRLATDTAMWAWLDRCRELANSELDGIEDPARELASLAAGDRVMMERARRVLTQALEHEPRNPLLCQMYAFWRRAFEKGSWSWEESPVDRSPYLSV